MSGESERDEYDEFVATAFAELPWADCADRPMAADWLARRLREWDAEREKQAAVVSAERPLPREWEGQGIDWKEAEWWASQGVASHAPIGHLSRGFFALLSERPAAPPASSPPQEPQEAGGDTHLEGDPETGRPPVGLRPQRIALEARLREIEAATARYYRAGLLVPPEWSNEYGDIALLLASAASCRVPDAGEGRQ